jgi:hypothetical protein
MKFPRPLLALISFGSAFGLGCYFKSPAGVTAAQSSSSPTALAVPRQISVALPAPAPVDPATQLLAMLALPASEQNDEALRKLAQILLPDDPEAACRACMACWGFAQSAFTKAADALVKKDPAAARRLLPECPDLRSRRVLEAALMADEVSRDPQNKLRWAEQNLEGFVRRKALTDGTIALAKLDPTAALDFVAELPPGVEKTNAAIKSLIPAFAKDPAQAIQWLKENTNPGERDIINWCATSGFVRDFPEAAQALLPTLRGEALEALALATLNSKIGAIKEPSEYFAKAADELRNLPTESRLSAVRSLTWQVTTSGESEGRTLPGLLASLTEPAERAAVIESAVTLRFASLNDPMDKSAEAVHLAAQEKTLSLLQTPQDRQAAARIVPFFNELTEAQKQNLLDRLK